MIGAVFRVAALTLLLLTLFYPTVDLIEKRSEILVGPYQSDKELFDQIEKTKTLDYRQAQSEPELVYQGEKIPIFSALSFKKIDPFSAFDRNHKFIRVQVCPRDPKIVEVAYPAFASVGQTVAIKFHFRTCSPSSEEFLLQVGDQTEKEIIQQSGARVFRATILTEGENCFSYRFGKQQGSLCVLGIEQGDTAIIGSLEESKVFTSRWKDIKYFPDLSILNDPSSKIRKLIILNQPVTALEGYADDLEKFVTLGGKLILFGGDRSFDNGGYRSSKIEQLLPVSSDEKKEKVLRGSLAVAVLVDKSGSMRIDNRMEKVRFALKSLIQSMRDEDYLTVIGFDTSALQLFPLTQIAGNRGKLASKVEALRAWGGTDPVQAMIIAKAGLENLTNAAVKHIIVLTDGEFKGDPGAILTMGDLINQSKISISGVLIGNEHSVILERLTKKSGGQMYRSPDGLAVPQIFLGDVYRRIPKTESVQKYSLKLENLEWRKEFGNPPQLTELNKVRSRGTSQIQAKSQPEEIPLIADRAVGKGLVRTVAFNPWSSLNRPFSSWIRLDDFVSKLIDESESLTFSAEIKKIGRYFIITRVNSYEPLTNDRIDFDPSLTQITRIPVDFDYEAIVVTFQQPGSTTIRISEKPVAKLTVEPSELNSPEDPWQNEALLNELVKLRGVQIVALDHQEALKLETPNSILLLSSAILWLLGSFFQQRRV